MTASDSLIERAMTPVQKIKYAILIYDHEERLRFEPDHKRPVVSADDVDALFEAANTDWELQDSIDGFRSGQVETDVLCQDSRHYESKSVAAKMPDGTWVGWTYWYGGGKHGEPEAIDWMDEAYDLDVTEEEKVVVVRTFSRAKEATQ